MENGKTQYICVAVSYLAFSGLGVLGGLGCTKLGQLVPSLPCLAQMPLHPAPSCMLLWFISVTQQCRDGRTSVLSREIQKQGFCLTLKSGVSGFNCFSWCLFINFPNHRRLACNKDWQWVKVVIKPRHFKRKASELWQNHMSEISIKCPGFQWQLHFLK